MQINFARHLVNGTETDGYVWVNLLDGPTIYVAGPRDQFNENGSIRWGDDDKSWNTASIKTALPGFFNKMKELGIVRSPPGTSSGPSVSSSAGSGTP